MTSGAANGELVATKRIGTGLCFVIFPVVLVFAFAVHPDLPAPRMLGPSEPIPRARGEDSLHFAHAIATVNTALMVVVALHFMRVLDGSPGARAGLVGATLAVSGTLAWAADKGASGLTMSALDDLSDAAFAAMMPGLLAMFSKQGWLVLIRGILLLPIGFGVQAIALLKNRSGARWQSVLFLVGVPLIATPDGVEIVSLTASILIAMALVPCGIRLVRGERRVGPAGGALG
jgi:hypothetical protein